jgi:hypothetical protein
MRRLPDRHRFLGVARVELIGALDAVRKRVPGLPTSPAACRRRGIRLAGPGVERSHVAVGLEEIERPLSVESERLTPGPGPFDASAEVTPELVVSVPRLLDQWIGGFVESTADVDARIVDCGAGRAVVLAGPPVMVGRARSGADAGDVLGSETARAQDLDRGVAVVGCAVAVETVPLDGVLSCLPMDAAHEGAEEPPLRIVHGRRYLSGIR